MDVRLALGLTLVALSAGCGDPGSRTATGADPAPDPRASVVARIGRDALTKPRAFELLASLVAAAPVRPAGSPGAQRAVEWGLATMRELGFENVHAEPCTVPHWQRGSVAKFARVGAGPAWSGDVCALGGSVATPAGGLEAGIVRVLTLDEVRANPERVRGRFVFFDRPMDPTLADPFAAYGGAVDQRSTGPVVAARAGAVGVVIRSVGFDASHAHTGMTHYDDAVARIPALALSNACADQLDAALAREPDLRARMELDCTEGPRVESASVVGELRGTSAPDEIVLLCAHLDAWDLAQGAHDDGAGCAHVLEALRLLHDADLRPRRTLRVALFMNEEFGLDGARAYAKAHQDEIARHAFALESDRGGFTPRGFQCDADEPAFGRVRSIVALLDGLGAGRLTRGGGGADTSPLDGAGVPCGEFLPDPARYFSVHHTKGDVLASVDPRELELGAASIAAFAWCVADDAEPWPRHAVAPRK